MRKFTLLFFLALTLPVLAQKRTDKELKSLATAQLMRDVPRTRGAVIPQVVKLDEADNYSVYGTGSSFVVLSNDKAFRPVLAVSHTPYLKGNMPCGFNWWVKTVSESLAEHNASRIYTRASVTVVDTMITTKWGQDSPYNDYTPRVNGQHAPTGCIATAMAQVMKFFEYPAKGQGIGNYTYGRRSRSSVISTTYNWDRMLDTYSSRSNVQNKIAVGNLMRDCGYASSMNYDTDGSGAYADYAALAFGRNFSYDSLSVRLYNRMFYTEGQWMQMIQSELLSHRPILYCGSDRSMGGHAFVFDGINSDGLVHVNWGWDGSANGYYSIDLLNPSGYSFTYGQSMILGLKAQAVPDTGEKLVSQWVSTGELKLTAQNPGIVNFSIDNLFNIDYRPFEGTVGLVFVNTATNDSTALLLLDTEGDSIGAVPYGNGFNLTDSTGEAVLFPVEIDSIPLAPGTYKAFVASQAYSETSATPILYYGGADYTFKFSVAADGTITGLEEVSGIRSVKSSGNTSSSRSSRTYSLDGREVGNNASGLTKGIYVRDGKKFLKR